jgi:hypothetical protein
MKRIHLFEFTDQPWYPQTFRQIQTDYLQFATTLGAGHKNLVPLFHKAMQKTGTDEIVDLCSGGAGPWPQLREYFQQAGIPVRVTLTDKYPNIQAVQKWANATGSIRYLAEPVDVAAVPAHLHGMRTLFEGFHHFQPEHAQAILRDACQRKAAIAIVDASLKPPQGVLLLLLSPLITFLAYLLVTPLIKPRTFSRFFWTYCLPLVPLATCWDGVVSMLRGYSLENLRELTAPLQTPGYTWEMGELSTGTPVFVFTYLLGYPE